MDENPPLAQDKAQEEVRTVKYNDLGVRAIRLMNIAFGGAPRAKLIMTIASRLDESVRILYILPEEHEVLALKEYMDQNFLTTNSTRISFNTYKNFRILLEGKSTSNKLVVVMDCSRMPLTVDMEICTGLLRDYIEKLAGAATGVVFTALFTESIYHRCQWWEDWSSGPVETTTIHGFGLSRPLILVEPISPKKIDARALLLDVLGKFAVSVQEAANAQLRQQGNEEVPQDVPSPRQVTAQVLLCVMQPEVMQDALGSLNPELRQRIETVVHFVQVDHSKKPSDWAATNRQIETKPPHHGAYVVILDPSIGIMHPMPRITQVYISRVWHTHRYDTDMLRVIRDFPDTLTPAQVREQISCLQGSKMASAASIIISCEPADLIDGPMAHRFAHTPSVTKDLMSLLLHAHLTWPDKKFPEMPIATLPSRKLLHETLYRLQWFNCIGSDGRANYPVSANIARVLEKIPDFNLALMLSRIDSNEDPMVAQALVQMALLLRCDPTTLLIDTHGSCVAGEADDVKIRAKQNLILEEFDDIGKKYLYSSHNVRKGTVFRAWIALQKAYHASDYKALNDNHSHIPVMHTIVDGIEMDLVVAKDIEKQTVTMWELLKLDTNKLDTLGLRLSEEQVCKVESHLAYAYLYNLATFNGQKDVSGKLVAIDISSSTAISMVGRSHDLLFTPPEKDPVTGLDRHAIIFDVFRNSPRSSAYALSELFISTEAVFNAVEAFTKGKYFEGEPSPGDQLYQIVTLLRIQERS